MRSFRQWTILNVTLALVAVILFATLLGLKLPSTGKALYLLDSEEPVCLVESDGVVNSWPDLDHCCLAARTQLQCLKETKDFAASRTDWSCFTSSSVQYYLNNKAYHYCQQTPIW